VVTFVDEVKLHLAAGDGGNGCVSVKRERYKPLAGPDGGNGGTGGSIWLVADTNTGTLIDYHYRPHRSAGRGDAGAGDFRNGAKGEDLILDVPVGTVVKNPQGDVLADLNQPGMKLEVAQGGMGGLGNAALASKRRKAPGFALLGIPGWSGEIVLELKTVADVALVGYPSAGKSSLIAAMSAARPKIADYPFTTLHPNLGVVRAGEKSYTIADVPGLIEGASEGKGLGLQFLRHIERCSVILHVIDCANLESDREPLKDYKAIVQELENYEVENGMPLSQRPQLIALNKIDLEDGETIAKMVRPEFEKMGLDVFEVSAISKQGLKELSFALSVLIDEHSETQADAREIISLVKQEPSDEFEVKAENSSEGVIFRITGVKPERWVAQTDFSNDEAVGYLAERLAKLGVEERLMKTGAKAGSTVIIGSENGVLFEWQPMISSIAEVTTPRGSDSRIDGSDRRTTKERREQYHEMMDSRSRMREKMQAEREASKLSEQYLDEE
jgi:GTP-binding protein